MIAKLYVSLTSRFRRRYVTQVELRSHMQPKERDPRLRWALTGIDDGLAGHERTPRPFPDDSLEEPYEIGHMIGCHLRQTALKRLGFQPPRGLH